VTGNQREMALALLFQPFSFLVPCWSAAVIGGRLQMLVLLFVFESDDISI